MSKCGNPGLKGRLIAKSTDAFVLALETINRLSIQYRVETFAYLICNAWELLLKAKIIGDTGKRQAIYYKKRRGEPRRTLALRDCLARVIPNEHEPVRRNVERVADLRDEAVHLVVAQVPKDIMALFQACVLNYHKRLKDWFGISLSDRVTVGMMTIVFDFDPAQFDVSEPLFRRQMGRETAEYLARFQAEVAEEFGRMGKPAEFSIDIRYRLALVAKPGEADIVLATASGGAATRIVEVPKDPSRSHPFRRTEVLAQFNAALEGKIKVGTFDIQCVVEVHGIRKRPEMYYKGSVKGSPVQYSHAFIEWMIQQCSRDDRFFQKARDRFKESR